MAAQPVQTPRTGRKPVKVAVTFQLLDADNNVLPGSDYRLKVLGAYRDMTAFADAIIDNPGSVPLYAKIEVPFRER